MSTLPKPPIVPPHQPIAAELESQLTLANKDRARLQAEHAELSFQVVTGASQDTKQVGTLANQIADLDARISMLTAARSVARKRDAERLAVIRVAGQKARIERTERMLATRLKHATELTDLLAKAAREYRLLIENSERAAILAPKVSPKAGLLGAVELKSAVAGELWRQSPGRMGNVGFDGFAAFPGGTPAHIEFRNQPDRTPALADRITEANAVILAELTRLIGLGDESVADAPESVLESLDPPAAPDPLATTPAPASASVSQGAPRVSGETGKPLGPFSLAATIAANPPAPTPTRHASMRAIRGH